MSRQHRSRSKATPTIRATAPLLLSCLLALILPGGDGLASSTDDAHALVAARWAPVIFQDVDEADGDNGKRDYILKLDFDGDSVLTNNWENLDNAGIDLSANVYYAVVETETHYYLSYYFYHPRDWGLLKKAAENSPSTRPSAASPAAIYHEHDLEGMTLVARKPASQLSDIVAMYTQAHDDTYYFPASAATGVHNEADQLTSCFGSSDHLDDLYGNIHCPEAEDRQLRFFAHPEAASARPAVFVEARVHGVGQIRRALEPAEDGWYFGSQRYEFYGEDGVVYYPSPTNEAGAPSATDREVAYQLLAFEGALWSHRHDASHFENDSSDPFITVTVSRAGGTPVVLANLGKTLLAADQDAGAHAPWAWPENSNCPNTDICSGIGDGAWFLDPAAFVKGHLTNLEDLADPGFGRYVNNRFLAGDNAIQPVQPPALQIGQAATLSWTFDEAAAGTGLQDRVSISLVAAGAEFVVAENVSLFDGHWDWPAVLGVPPGDYSLKIVGYSEAGDWLEVVGETRPFPVSYAFEIGEGSRDPVAFQAAYERISTAASPWLPTGVIAREGAGEVQEFVRQQDGTAAILSLRDGATEAFATYGAIYQKYLALGRGLSADLGYPVSDEWDTAPSPYSPMNPGRRSHFESGVILYNWSQNQAFALYGANAEYFLHDGVDSWHGWPTGDTHQTVEGTRTDVEDGGYILTDLQGATSGFPAYGLGWVDYYSDDDGSLILMWPNFSQIADGAIVYKDVWSQAGELVESTAIRLEGPETVYHDSAPDPGLGYSYSVAMSYHDKAMPRSTPLTFNLARGCVPHPARLALRTAVQGGSRYGDFALSNLSASSWTGSLTAPSGVVVTPAQVSLAPGASQTVSVESGTFSPETATVVVTIGDGCSRVTCLDTGYPRSVCYVSPAGSDETGDGSSSKPFRSPQLAVDAVALGGEVIFKTGTYVSPTIVLQRDVSLRSETGRPQDVLLSPPFNRRILDCYGLSARARLSGLTFTGGTTTDDDRGAGLYMHGCSAQVVNCRFLGNSAAGHAGSLYLHESSPLLENCEFRSSSAGGGGGMYIDGSSNPSIRYCVFAACSASDGGAILGAHTGMPAITNCTFYNNWGAMGGAAVWGGGYAMDNCIVAFNQGMDTWAPVINGSNVTLSCCDVFGNTPADYDGGISGQLGTRGNISLDPLFANAESGDLRLLSGSPCLAHAPAHPDCGLAGALPLSSTVAAGAPANLTATDGGTSGVWLTWEDPVATATRFDLERKTGLDGVWAIRTQLPAGTREWNESSVVAGQSYYYRLRAWNEAGYSAYSNTAGVTAGSLLAAPVITAIAPAQPFGVNIQWLCTASNESGFLIQKRLVEGLDTSWKDCPVRPAANATAHRDESTTLPGTYEFRIQAYNRFGSSEWSAPAPCVISPPSAASASVVVRFGGCPAGGAQLFVDEGSGFGATPFVADGNGVVQLARLPVGSKLRARLSLSSRSNPKGDHGELGGLLYELWYDSDVPSLSWGDLEYAPFQVTEARQTYELDLAHPVLRYNLLVAFDAPLSAGTQWPLVETAFQKVSDYIYNASDGYLALGKVVAYDAATGERGHWLESADVRFRSSWGPTVGDQPFTWSQQEGSGFDVASKSRFIGVSGKIFGVSWDKSASLVKALAHEFGHFAVGLGDEYMDGRSLLNDRWGGFMDVWALYDFGLMDNDSDRQEMSFNGDYALLVPPHDPNNSKRSTAQSFAWKSPCWGRFVEFLTQEDLRRGVACQNERRVQFSPPGPVMRRNGPTTDTPRVEFVRRQAAAVLAATPLSLREGDRALSGTAVFELARDGRGSYLGTTDAEGRLPLPPQLDDRELRVFRPVPGGYARRDVPAAALAASATVDWLPASAEPPRPGKARDLDVTPPLALLEAAATGSSVQPSVHFRLRPEEPLGAEPIVTAFCNGAADSVRLTPAGDAYEGWLQLAPQDTLPKYHAILTVALADTAGNPNSLLADLWLDPYRSGTNATLWMPPASFHVGAGNALPDVLACGVVAPGAPGVGAMPGRRAVTPVLSFHLGEDDVCPQGASLNVAYTDSAVQGLDEASLRLYRWDDAAAGWAEVDSSWSAPRVNGVSALVERGGAYCVLGQLAEADSVAPGAVEDFSAVANAEWGGLTLEWTAPGDDGLAGTAAEYVLVYSDSALTAENWEAARKLHGFATPAAGGSRQSAAIGLSTQGRLYYLALIARDESGNVSPLSNVTYAVTGIADPNFVVGPALGLRAVDRPHDAGGAVALAWLLSVDDGAGKGTVLGYRIHRDLGPGTSLALLDSVPAGTAAYVDSTVADDRSYTYLVGAWDGEQEVFGGPERAFSARDAGALTGDFTSDGRVGVDDLARLADAVHTDSTQTVFEPLFDLKPDGAIDAQDGAVFAAAFGDGGAVAPGGGSNAGAEIVCAIQAAENDTWYADIMVNGALALSAYSARVVFLAETASLVSVTTAPPGGGVNFLNSSGGATPLTVIESPAAGVVLLANAIQDASALSCPNGDGFLARLTFHGPGPRVVDVTDAFLVDADRRIDGATTRLVDVAGEGWPARPLLFPNCPNPFNAKTVIVFYVPRDGELDLSIYNVRGQLVRRLVRGFVRAGYHAVPWDGADDRGRLVASGVYLYRLSTAMEVKTRKLLLIK